MNSTQPPKQNDSFAALRRFVRPRGVALEHCDMCNAELAAEHQHLIDPLSRQLICACQPCAILFDNPGETKYKSVPRRIRYLSDFRLTDAQWDNLRIPIQLAFFFNSTVNERIVALYPGPAGATESLLSFESWSEMAAENPILERMEADVEALLVNRVGNTREYYIVPIDECYKLVGLIRTHWSGLSGGTEVWREIAEFYARLKERSSEIKNA